VSFRPTEYTVRELLIEELKKRGVKVTPEISFVSPVGRFVWFLICCCRMVDVMWLRLSLALSRS